MALDTEYYLISSLIIFISLIIIITGFIGYQSFGEDLPNAEEMNDFNKVKTGLNLVNQDIEKESSILALFYKIFIVSPILLILTLIAYNALRGRG